MRVLRWLGPVWCFGVGISTGLLTMWLRQILWSQCDKGGPGPGNATYVMFFLLPATSIAAAVAAYLGYALTLRRGNRIALVAAGCRPDHRFPGWLRGTRPGLRTTTDATSVVRHRTARLVAAMAAAVAPLIYRIERHARRGFDPVSPLTWVDSRCRFANPVRQGQPDACPSASPP